MSETGRAHGGSGTWQQDPLLHPRHGTPGFTLDQAWSQARKPFAPLRIPTLDLRLPAPEPEPEPAEVQEAAAPQVDHATQPPEPECVPVIQKGYTADELDKAVRQAQARGLAEGRQQAEAEFAALTAALRELMGGIRAAVSAPQGYLDPLKRLAVALAGQIARKELELSPQTIDGLIRKCLAELEDGLLGVTLVHLNPDDLALYRTHIVEHPDDIELRPDPSMSRGSVRLTMGDSAVEDFFEQRLDAVARSVLGHGQPGGAP